MSDLISRQAAIDAVNNAFDRETLLSGFVRSIAVRAIRNMPSVEPKHGHWDIEISHDGYQATYHCSECGHQFKWIYDRVFPPVFKYCQKCGAKMEEEHE